MQVIRSTHWLLAAVASSAFVSSAPAQEIDRFAVVTIRNSTNGNMTFYRQWVWNPGTSNERVAIDWRVTIIPPGKTYTVHWTYQDAAKRSPELIVVFDSDRKQARHWQKVMLDRAASTDKRGGYVYALEYDDQRKEFASLNAKGKGKVTVLDRKSTAPANAERMPFDQ